MGDIPSGWALLLSAILGSAGVITAAVMQVRTRSDVRKVGRDAAVVREQVQNSHDTNMREEGDSRHDEVLTEFSILREYIREELRDIRRNLTRLSTDQSQDRADIRQLEKPRRNRNVNENDDQH
jgi:hypothetical protein